MQSVTQVEHAAAAALTRRLSDSPGQIAVKPVALDRRLRLKQCQQPLRAGLQGQIRGGIASMKVRCTDADGWVLYVQVSVQHFRKVLVVARTVGAGDAVAGADLTTESVDVARVGPGGYYTDSAALTDKVAARTLTPGTLLSPQVLRAATLVQRNQSVRLIALAGAARIESRGVALQPGAKNDLVRVRNSASGRVVQGRVVAPGEVLVGG